MILALVLQFLDAGTARQVTGGYASRAAPGSAVVISVGRNDDPQMWATVREQYTAAELHNHDRDEVTSFFTGLDVVPPGLARRTLGAVRPGRIEHGSRRVQAHAPIMPCRLPATYQVKGRHRGGRL